MMATKLVSPNSCNKQLFKKTLQLICQEQRTTKKIQNRFNLSSIAIMTT